MDACDCPMEWDVAYEWGLRVSGQRVSYLIPLTGWIARPSEEL